MIHIYSMKTSWIHKFVDIIPDVLDDKTLYVSIEHNVVIHKCACGCNNEVVTPIATSDWQLLYDGKTISLTPSIGNWGFKCKSHYWIRYNKVVFAKDSGDKTLSPLRKKRKNKQKKSLWKRIFML